MIFGLSTLLKTYLNIFFLPLVYIIEYFCSFPFTSKFCDFVIVGSPSSYNFLSNFLVSLQKFLWLKNSALLDYLFDLSKWEEVPLRGNEPPPT